jgi:hypothetical protein
MAYMIIVTGKNVGRLCNLCWSLTCFKVHWNEGFWFEFFCPFTWSWIMNFLCGVSLIFAYIGILFSICLQGVLWVQYVSPGCVVSSVCVSRVCCEFRLRTPQLRNTTNTVPVGFEVLTAASMKMAVFWVVAPCTGRSLPTFQRSLLPLSTGQWVSSALTDSFLYRKAIPRARLTHRPDDGGSKVLWNVGRLLPDYMAQRPRRQPSSQF